MGVGVVYVGITAVAVTRARAGWAAGHSDIGFWWTVIASLLAIAALGAIVGTWIHTQESRG